MREEREYRIALHRDAPEKPAYGAPCNRCGICCAAEPCPIGRLRFLQLKGPCPALLWDGGAYACALVAAPERYFPWLPNRWRPIAGRLFSRAISAGSGCDSADEVIAGDTRDEA